jgi:hypothetical protein
MIDGACNPEYIARRVLHMASEDIGNADPRALTLALDAWEIFRSLVGEGVYSFLSFYRHLQLFVITNHTFILR